MKKLWTVLLVAVLAITAGCGDGNDGKPSAASSASGEKVELHVSAAASLTDVMNEIGADYEKEHPNVKVVFNYGSSGALQQAIESGGGADLFFSAAQKQMNALEKAGLLADGTRKDLLVNEVVLIVPKDGGKDIPSFDQLARADVQRVALGEPKGVPVGQYSEEILTKLGILDAVKAKAVYGSDVRQVLTWVEGGDVDAGLVYATDAAISEKVKVTAQAPADSHKPIVYPVAILKETKQMDAAKDFLAFATNDANKKRFEQYGFEVK
ncbi:molybdate ABC transporter substrate-binding protein [uncultured Mitsuokella sp.]|uniref:molybdate ABC transporter substrate-binding protein n=1 Tax=uncultured Mitsuokella sp. TaxID=453120 RepID=UPI0026303A38|nr:molybdate ABC transporter substrate-binding protein [uncultured Mitsuokella sp.]